MDRGRGAGIGPGRGVGGGVRGRGNSILGKSHVVREGWVSGLRLPHTRKQHNNEYSEYSCQKQDQFLHVGYSFLPSQNGGTLHSTIQGLNRWHTDTSFPRCAVASSNHRHIQFHNRIRRQASPIPIELPIAISKLSKSYIHIPLAIGLKQNFQPR